MFDFLPVNDSIKLLKCLLNCSMIIAVGILGDGAEVIVGKDCVDFFIVVMGVYNYCCLAFVSSGKHGVVFGDFLVNMFYDMQLSFRCGVVVVGVVLHS